MIPVRILQPPREALLLAYGLLAAVLACGVTPLWEGIDEPFHYGCVQEIARQGKLPALHRTVLSEEIYCSLPLAPASPLAKRNLPQVPTFDEYFRMPVAERAAMRGRLESLNPSLADSLAQQASNYEAQQVPLAYLLLAPLDRSLASLPLLERVLALRLVCGVLAVLMLFFAARAMLGDLGVPAPYRALALFALFSTQALFATIAHIANDWLAVGLSAWWFQAALGRRTYQWAAATALGLLTKAYFLALLPVALVYLFWPALAAVAVAAPAYIRNRMLYGSITGMQEAVQGIGPAQVIAALAHVSLLKWAGDMARFSLWFGNASFLSFSRLTLNVLLVCYVAGFILVIRRANRTVMPVLLGMAMFSAALIYSSGQTAAFASGGEMGKSAWYSQVLITPALCLIASALARWGRPGVLLGCAIAALNAYVQALTYIAKLIPLYAGAGEGRAQPAALFQTYIHGWTSLTERLAATAPAPPAFVLPCAFTLAAAGLALGIWIAFTLRLGVSAKPGVA